MKQYKGFVFVILSAVIFGCVPLLAKIVYANGANAPSLVFYRNLLPLPALFWLMRRGLREGERCLLPPKKLGQIAVLSLGFAGTPLLLMSSYNYIPSGTATTIHFVYPVFVLIGCILFFHDRVSRVKILCAALCMAGILLFYTPGEQGGLFGILLAFVSGITYAFYIIYLDKSGLAATPPFQLAFYLAAMSAAEALAFALLTGQLTARLTPLGWAASAALALAATVGASILFQIGVKDVGPQRAAILSTFEPITSIIVGIAVFSEPFGVKIALGVVLILAAVLMLTLFDRETV